MSYEPDNAQLLSKTHPCYSEDAQIRFARMHVPVAPKCNIRCNYCNRKFDCCNESRPGVTSEILSPELAIKRIREVKKKIQNLKVIGIAGPGDPLANESTFDTLSMISKEFSDMSLCVSTNGLELPRLADRLYNLNVRFITVTMNSCSPETGAKIYDSVSVDGVDYHGIEGAKILMERQTDGIKKCVSLGITVKVNIVMIPGVNYNDIPQIVSLARSLGVYAINILPLIPLHGTKFQNLRAPTSTERKIMMDLCSPGIKMMRHCKQCRADAIGLLGKDRQKEFISIIDKSTYKPILTSPPNNDNKIAIATTDGIHVDSGFGNASKFVIYSINGSSYKLVDEVLVNMSGCVYGDTHKDHINSVIKLLSGCNTIIVKEIGPLPLKILSDAGVHVITTNKDVNESIMDLPKQGTSL